jgi:hypothetical protein
MRKIYDPETITFEDFRNQGYLQEVNRQFFHPLGLSLSIDIGADRKANPVMILDCRDDPEGIIFDESLLDSDESRQKARLVEQEQREHPASRKSKLGYIIQSIPEAPKKKGGGKA